MENTNLTGGENVPRNSAKHAQNQSPGRAAERPPNGPAGGSIEGIDIFTTARRSDGPLADLPQIVGVFGGLGGRTRQTNVGGCYDGHGGKRRVD